MRSPLSAICLLLTLGRTAFGSTVTLGYNCDNEYFPFSDLQKAANQAMNIPGHVDPNFMKLKELSHQYDGPPFTRSYLLWPIFRETSSHRGAAEPTPFRVALDNNYEVFSVIVKNEEGIRECKIHEKYSRYDTKNLDYSYSCEGSTFSVSKVKQVARIACYQIQQGSIRRFREGSMGRFPARYDGPYDGVELRTHGRQLYLYPILESGLIYQHGKDPGSTFLMLNSRCRVEGVFQMVSSKYKKCTDMLSMSSIREPWVIDAPNEAEQRYSKRYKKNVI